MLAGLPQQNIYTTALERTIYIFLSIKLFFCVNITCVKYLTIMPFSSCILNCSGPCPGVAGVSVDTNAAWENLPLSPKH